MIGVGISASPVDLLLFLRHQVVDGHPYLRLLLRPHIESRIIVQLFHLPVALRNQDRPDHKGVDRIAHKSERRR